MSSQAGPRGRNRSAGHTPRGRRLLPVGPPRPGRAQRLLSRLHRRRSIRRLRDPRRGPKLQVAGGESTPVVGAPLHGSEGRTPHSTSSSVMVGGHAARCVALFAVDTSGFHPKDRADHQRDLVREESFLPTRRSCSLPARNSLGLGHAPAGISGRSPKPRQSGPGHEVDRANEAPNPLLTAGDVSAFRTATARRAAFAALETLCTRMRPVFLVKQLAKEALLPLARVGLLCW